MTDEYDVSQYTESELLNILNLTNPSDRELEAKIISMIRKYNIMENAAGKKLAKFFEDIYDFFFEPDTDYPTTTPMVEGLTTLSNTPGIGGNTTSKVLHENLFTSSNMDWGNVQIPETAPMDYANINGTISNVNMGSVVTPAKDNLQLTRPLDYSKDSLNPLLKQTIKRIISIDSQYRDQKNTTATTSFTFNLSEPMRDVVSLSLYSIQIPYTWYTINSDFGGNFFYLKGNSVGINNGNHDYQISVPSGNYQPADLATAINTGIQNARLQYTDVSFGDTRIIYNNNLSPSSGTGKCALQIEIKKVFNEQNYQLEFPSWTPPLNLGTRIYSIPGYLGFNEQQYSCSSIYSNFISITSNSPNQTVFLVNTAITDFNIVPYIGSAGLLLADICYNPIPINLNLPIGTQYLRSELVSRLNTVLMNTQAFDVNYTGCSWINITDPSSAGYPGSYIAINCKLTKDYAPTLAVANVKLAAVFKYDPNTIFYGFGSVFNMPTIVTDLSQGVVCEFNELIGETPINQTDYTSIGTYFTLECNADPSNGTYDNQYNNITVAIPNNSYTLYSFVDAVNSAIALNDQYPNAHQTSKLKGTMFLDASNYLNLQTNVVASFTTSNYHVRVTGTQLTELFGLSSQPANITGAFSQTYSNDSITLLYSVDEIIIGPSTQGTGNFSAAPWIIKFGSESSTNYTTTIFSNATAFIQNAIVSYVDPVTGLTPLSESTVSYNPTGSIFELNLQIRFNINQSLYLLRLYPDNSGNIWQQLGFDASYTLQNYSATNYTITSDTESKDLRMTIRKGTNDIFSFNPYTNIDGLYTTSNAYSINITIPDNTNGLGTQYSVQQLLNEINSQLANNPISVGCVFSTITLNNQLYAKIHFNLNKVFLTKDYRLVFYDPYSFVTCYSSSARNGSNYAQNTTWDSTLGWILGYRNDIQYYMSEYDTIFYPSASYPLGSPPQIYYSSSSSNLFVILGDTAASTNLYNYFLIMLDDYVQNHLNDGLVTIATHETSTDPGAYTYICDPATGLQTAVPADYGSPGIIYTQAELYAFNRKVQSQKAELNSYSSGPFVQDIFGIIPVKPAASVGSVYVEFGGSLQNQQRLYFGPVNIHRMSIKLLNDRGNIVDLNGANWSFSLICEQLYRSGVS